MDREGGPEPGNSKIVSLDVPSIYRLGRFEVYIYIFNLPPADTESMHIWYNKTVMIRGWI